MGKPSVSAGSKPSASDAVSLHSNTGGESYRDAYRDIDDDDAPQLAVDDLPPSYGHALQQHHPPSAATDEPSAPLVASAPEIPPFREDASTGARFYVDRRLEDPARLERHVRQEAATPPRPYLRLVGTHRETTRDRKGKSESSTVTDFDVGVELTPFLYADAQYRRSWSYLRTVENGEKARRGTVFARRAPGSQQDVEVGFGPDKPTLQEWCHRFGASPAGLKCFVLRRRMVGFDEAGVVYRLRRLVLDTNYRGNLVVELRTKNERVECYNDARVNRWRFNPWAWWLAVLSLMFVFTWPYLWLRTRRWEVAVAEWPFSRTTEDGRKEYVSISEDQWYNLWARAICKAVLEKRQATLDQEDLRRSQEPEPALNSGHAGVDGAVGLFRAGLSAMNEVNRQLGWGGDC